MHQLFHYDLFQTYPIFQKSETGPRAPKNCE